jgi:hypothetical protein
MQRLHQDDLAGVLLRGSDEWTALSLPRLPNKPSRFQLAMDKCMSVASATCCTRRANQGTFLSRYALSSVSRFVPSPAGYLAVPLQKKPSHRPRWMPSWRSQHDRRLLVAEGADHSSFKRAQG